MGVTLPYLTLYLQGLGLSGEQVGWVQMIQPLCAAPAGLVWAATADRLRAARGALALSSGFTALAYAALLGAHGTWSVAAVMAVLGLGGAGLVPLIDGLTVEWIAAHAKSGAEGLSNNRRRFGAASREPGAASSAESDCSTDIAPSYARTRLFGSIGYVIAAQGLGLFLMARGSRPADPLVPLALLLCSAGCATVALGVPRAPVGPRPHARDAWALCKKPQLLLLLGFCALHWVDLAPYNVFFGPLARAHALPDSVIGLASALGVAAEVGVLAVAPALEARFSTRALFALAFGATALRWAALGQAQGAAAIVGLQALHGLSFGLFWATAVRALQTQVPAPLRATGQALFGAVVFQLGSALGNPLSGWAYERVGPSRLFAWAAWVELLPLALLVLWRERGR